MSTPPVDCDDHFTNQLRITCYTANCYLLYGNTAWHPRRTHNKTKTYYLKYNLIVLIILASKASDESNYNFPTPEIALNSQGKQEESVAMLHVHSIFSVNFFLV